MSEFNFKEGDEVYCPIATNKVLQISSDLRTRYQNAIGTDVNVTVYPTGKWNELHHNPTFFPATQEWYDKLVHVYPDLEAPPKQKEPIDVVIAMLDGGYKTVCLAAPLFGYEIVGNPTHARNACRAVKIFKPYNLKKGKYIVDFIDGKCVLENGEVVSED